jgi:hypothetical protein
MHVDDARHFVPLPFTFQRLEMGTLDAVASVALDFEVSPDHVHATQVELNWAELSVAVGGFVWSNNGSP